MHLVHRDQTLGRKGPWRKVFRSIIRDLGSVCVRVSAAVIYFSLLSATYAALTSAAGGPAEVASAWPSPCWPPLWSLR